MRDLFSLFRCDCCFFLSHKVFFGSHRDTMLQHLAHSGIIYLPFVCSFFTTKCFLRRNKNAYIGICYLLFILTKPFVCDYDIRCRRLRFFRVVVVVDLHTHHKNIPSSLGKYFPIDRRANKTLNQQKREEKKVSGWNLK